MDRAKLAELRKKKAQQKANAHQKLLDSNASIKESILFLSESINNSIDTTALSNQLKELKDSLTFKEDVERLETALKSTGDVSIERLDSLLDAIGSINNGDVVEAVNSLLAKLDDQTIKQDPKDFQPVRRVRKLAGKLVFDDDPLPVNVVSGGGKGGIAAYKDSDGKVTQAQLTSQGKVPVSTGDTAGIDFDFIDVQQTSPTVETIVKKLGGVAGTIVRTIVVTYTDSTKNDIDTVVYS